MSKGLDNTFNEILARSGNVFFVDRLWVKSLAEGQWTKTLDLHRSLELASNEQSESFFRIDVKHLTSEKLIRYFLNKSDLSGAADVSDYDVLMEAVSKLKPGVVVFYRTHLISPDTLRLLSKLIGYVQQHNLGWKFVLYGKAKKLTHIAKNRLYIEHYYPEECEHVSQVNSKTVDDDAPLEEKEQTAKRFDFVKGLLVFLVIVLSAALVYLVGERSPGTLDNQQPVEDAIVDRNLDKKDEQSELQGDIHSSQTLKEMIEESKLQELEFEKAIAELNASIRVEVSAAEDVADSKSVNVAAGRENGKNGIEVKGTQALSTEIEQAISENNLAFLEALADKSVLAYGRNSIGQTALMISVNNGHEQIVRWLLQRNVPVDSKDSYGRTALFYAAIQGNENFVDQLVRAGARVSLSSSLSKTPLMAAVHNNHYGSAQLLLATGKTAINVRDHSGWSALFYAVWNSNARMASLLLDFGASVDLVDNSGLSVDQVAKAAGFDAWRNRVKTN